MNTSSSEPNFCEGLFPFASKHYIMGVNLAVAKVGTCFAHPGSSGLDTINAFDTAEISSALISQINAIEVSSFCGPNGLIWGYHVARADTAYHGRGVKAVEWRGKTVPVYSVDGLVDALCFLFGILGKP